MPQTSVYALLQTLSANEKKNYAILAQEEMTKSRYFGLNAIHGSNPRYPGFKECLNTYCLVREYLNVPKLDLANAEHSDLLVLGRQYLFNDQEPQSYKKLDPSQQIKLILLADHALQSKEKKEMSASEVFDWAALAATPSTPASLSFTLISKLLATHEKAQSNSTNPTELNNSFLNNFSDSIFTDGHLDNIKNERLQNAISKHTVSLLTKKVESLDSQIKTGNLPSTVYAGDEHSVIPQRIPGIISTENAVESMEKIEIEQCEQFVDHVDTLVTTHLAVVEDNKKVLQIPQETANQSDAKSSVESLKNWIKPAKKIVLFYSELAQENKIHKAFKRQNNYLNNHLERIHKEYGIKLQFEEIESIFRDTPKNPLPSIMQLFQNGAAQGIKDTQECFLRITKELQTLKTELQQAKDINTGYLKDIAGLQKLQTRIGEFVKSVDYNRLPSIMSQTCNLASSLIASNPAFQATPIGMAAQALCFVGSLTFDYLAKNEKNRAQKKVDNGQTHVAKASDIIEHYDRLRASNEQSVQFLQEAITTREQFLRENAHLVPSKIKEEILTNQKTDLENKLVEIDGLLNTNKAEKIALTQKKSEQEQEIAGLRLKLQYEENKAKRRKKVSQNASLYSEKLTEKELELEKTNATLATLDATQNALTHSQRQLKESSQQVDVLMQKDSHLNAIDDWWYEYLTGKNPKSLAELEQEGKKEKTEAEKIKDIKERNLEYCNKALAMTQHRRQALGKLFKTGSSLADALTPFIGDRLKTGIDISSVLYESGENFFFMYDFSLSRLMKNLEDSQRDWAIAVEKFGGNWQFINEFISPSLASIASVISLVANLTGCTKSSLSITLDAIRNSYESLSQQLRIGFKEMDERFDEARKILRRMENAHKHNFNVLRALSESTAKTSSLQSECLSQGILTVSRQVNNQLLVSILKKIDERVEKLSRLKKELTHSKNVSDSQFNTGVSRLWGELKYSASPSSLEEQSVPLVENLSRVHHYLDFVPYLKKQLLPNSPPVFNYRVVKKTLTTLKALLENTSTKQASVIQNQDFGKIISAGENLYHFLQGLTHDLNWLDTIRKKNIRVYQQLYQLKDTIIADEKEKCSQSKNTVSLLAIEQTMLVNLVGTQKFFIHDFFNLPLAKQMPNLSRSTFKEQHNSAATVAVLTSVLGLASLIVPPAAPVIIGSLVATTVRSFKDLDQLVKSFSLENILSLIENQKEYTEILHTTLILYYSLSAKQLVLETPSMSDNKPGIETAYFNQIKSPLKITIQPYIYDRVHTGTHRGKDRYRNLYASDSFVTINGVNATVVFDKLNPATHRNYDDKLKQAIKGYFVLLQDETALDKIDKKIVYSVASQQENFDNTIAEIPLLFPKSYLAEREKHRFIQYLFHAEKLGLGTVLRRYKLDFDPKYGASLFLKYDFLTPQGHIYSAVSIEVANFDATTVNSFQNLKIENNHYSWQINLNEFLFIAMEGTSVNLGFPGKGSYDFNGAVYVVEFYFPGLSRCLTKMRNSTFVYNAEQYDVNRSIALRNYVDTEEDEGQVVADFIDNELVMYFDADCTELQTFLESGVKKLGLMIKTNDEYKQALSELYQLYEVVLIAIQLCYPFSLHEAIEILDSFTILNPKTLDLTYGSEEGVLALMDELKHTSVSPPSYDDIRYHGESSWLIELKEILKQLNLQLPSRSVSISNIRNLLPQLPVRNTQHPSRPVSQQRFFASNVPPLPPRAPINLGYSQRVNDLMKVAQKYHLEVEDVKGNGDCFFYAVRDQLLTRFKREMSHLELRTQSAEWLRNHPEQLDFILRKPGENFKTATTHYLNKISQSGNWVDHLQVQALAKAYNINMVIIPDKGKEIFIRIEKNPAKIIYLGFIDEKHYVSLRGTPLKRLEEELGKSEIYGEYSTDRQVYVTSPGSTVSV